MAPTSSFLTFSLQFLQIQASSKFYFTSLKISHLYLFIGSWFYPDCFDYLCKKRRHRTRKRQKQNDELTRLLQAPRTQPPDMDQVVQEVLFGPQAQVQPNHHNPSISDDELTHLLQAPWTQPPDVDQVVQEVLFGPPAQVQQPPPSVHHWWRTDPLAAST